MARKARAPKRAQCRTALALAKAECSCYRRHGCIWGYECKLQTAEPQPCPTFECSLLPGAPPAVVADYAESEGQAPSARTLPRKAPRRAASGR